MSCIALAVLRTCVPFKADLNPNPPTHPQAETLGNLFRNVMYPPSAGGGLLRLHSTYRHDLKIYSSGGWSGRAGWGGVGWWWGGVGWW